MLDCDWSSDVCSSDLSKLTEEELAALFGYLKAGP
jgi:hypothetical protein